MKDVDSVDASSPDVSPLRLAQHDNLWGLNPHEFDEPSARWPIGTGARLSLSLNHVVQQQVVPQHV